jgi:hypothetical protein
MDATRRLPPNKSTKLGVILVTILANQNILAETLANIISGKTS